MVSHIDQSFHIAIKYSCLNIILYMFQKNIYSHLKKYHIILQYIIIKYFILKRELNNYLLIYFAIFLCHIFALKNETESVYIEILRIVKPKIYCVFFIILVQFFAKQD